MTERSIEELRRYRDIVRARANEARREYERAHDEYAAAVIAQAEAEFAARGIVKGSRVIGEWKRSGGTGSVTGIYCGHSASFGSDPDPIIRKAKRDGTAHPTHAVYASWDAEWRLAE